MCDKDICCTIGYDWTFYKCGLQWKYQTEYDDTFCRCTLCSVITFRSPCVVQWMPCLSPIPNDQVCIPCLCSMLATDNFFITLIPICFCGIPCTRFKTKKSRSDKPWQRITMHHRYTWEVIEMYTCRTCFQNSQYTTFRRVEKLSKAQVLHANANIIKQCTKLPQVLCQIISSYIYVRRS